MRAGKRDKIHVAIIMDGNGRWAAARKMPRSAGHHAGMEAVRRTVKACKALSVSHLTLYSFSSENWNRSASEVGQLMQLLRLYIRNELDDLHKEGVRIRMIGDRSRLPGDIVQLIVDAEEKTRGNTGLNLTLALSYGGRQELTFAAQRLVRAVQAGDLQADAITEETVESFLDTADLPDPDLVIRTSGEKRISNFLLWQSAYAEYVFQDVLWPDFGSEHLKEAIDEFHKRERRYGLASENE